MMFSVIYSVDVPEGVGLRPFLPTRRRLFDTTEGDDQFEYSYLEGRWTRGRHRKLCAMLTREQFERFLEDTGLRSEDVQTLGSIGAPGFGYGHAPAISFTSDEEDAILSAYVTPIPQIERTRRAEAGDLPDGEALFDERDWERVRRAVIRVYRQGA